MVSSKTREIAVTIWSSEIRRVTVVVWSFWIRTIARTIRFLRIRRSAVKFSEIRKPCASALTSKLSKRALREGYFREGASRRVL